MSEIVIPSDSDDSICLSQNIGKYSPVAGPSRERKRSLSKDSSDDFTLPEVQFHYTSEPIVTASGHTHYTELTEEELNAELDKFCAIPSTSGINTRSDKPNHGYPMHYMSNSSESEDESLQTCPEGSRKDNSPSKAKPKKTKVTGKVVTKQGRNKQNVAKQKDQGDSQKQKLLKEITARKSKIAKGGIECMKLVEAILDEGIKESIYFNEIVTQLEKHNIQYSTCSQLIPNSITWKRTCVDYIITDDNKIETVQDTKEEDHIVVILNWHDTVEKVAEDTLQNFIASVKTLTNCDVTLVIYGIEDYFMHWEQRKNRAKSDRNEQNQRSFTNTPRISRDELEISLIRLQIIFKCNNRILDTSEEMGLLVYNYSRCIALRSYRIEKEKKMEERLQWHMLIDETDSVKVDNDGNGLKKVWQRQLCDFNKSSLEVAEAITSVYPSPAALVEAYQNCTPSEGINLLKDIPIRRAAGPLTTARKVGPELSKKIYIMFTATDGDTLL